MKTKRSLFLIIFIITIRAGFAQEVQEKIEYPNLVKNGDFESGNVGFKSDFIFTEIFTEEDFWDWGGYVITDSVVKDGMGVTFWNPHPNTGKYYAVKVNKSGKQRLWYDSITVQPNTTYEFRCILANIRSGAAVPGFMRLKINGKTCCSAVFLSNESSWTPFRKQYKTGTDETRIEISIVDELGSMSGTALDNIVFKEIPPEKFKERKYK